MLSAHRPMYDLLFGDAPMHAWPASERGAEGEAWKAFIAARARWNDGDHEGAIAGWRAVLGMDGLESRHHAQAWTFLRGAGVMPEGGEATRLLGVILEVPVEAGLDILACYPDHSAYYLNHAGPAIIWAGGSDALNGTIDPVLDVARGIVARTGVWERARLEPAHGGLARVNMLTPAGLHFGQAPASVLFADPMAAPLLSAGAALMQAMMEVERRKA